MTRHIAQCEHDEGQRIEAHHNGISVIFDGYSAGDFVTEPFLSPADARTFARGILALADEVDRGEVEAKPAPDSRPKVGDRVIVVEDDPDGLTGKFVGLVGTLTKDDGGSQVPYLVKFGDGSHGDVDGQWYCRKVEKVADEPEPLADWEKDLLKPTSPTTATITTPTREAYLHRAAELLGANPSASDLIKLADYLAGESA